MTDDIQRAKEGDGDAAWRLLVAHGDSVRRYIAAQIARATPRVDVDEVTNDAFTKAFQNFHRFRGDEQAQVEAWLQKIAVNTLRDIRRAGNDRHIERRPVDVDEVVGRRTSISRNVARKDLIRQVREELTTSSVRLLSLLGKGLNAKSIAKAMGISAGNVRQRKRRLRNWLTLRFGSRSR